jgi:hypothetical protein
MEILCCCNYSSQIENLTVKKEKLKKEKTEKGTGASCLFPF